MDHVNVLTDGCDLFPVSIVKSQLPIQTLFETEGVAAEVAPALLTIPALMPHPRAGAVWKVGLAVNTADIFDLLHMLIALYICPLIDGIGGGVLEGGGVAVLD